MRVQDVFRGSLRPPTTPAGERPAPSCETEATSRVPITRIASLPGHLVTPHRIKQWQTQLLASLYYYRTALSTLYSGVSLLVHTAGISGHHAFVTPAASPLNRGEDRVSSFHGRVTRRSDWWGSAIHPKPPIPPVLTKTTSGLNAAAAQPASGSWARMSAVRLRSTLIHCETAFGDYFTSRTEL